MKLGVTGTREGLTFNQKRFGRAALLSLFKSGYRELHHGDCVGADAQVAEMARSIGYRIICHPPLVKDHRAFFPSDEYKEELGYLARDRRIVQSVDLLLVFPKQNKWHSQGGTWYTHDYAVKTETEVCIIYPDRIGFFKKAHKD